MTGPDPDHGPSYVAEERSPKNGDRIGHLDLDRPSAPEVRTEPDPSRRSIQTVICESLLYRPANGQVRGGPVRRTGRLIARFANGSGSGKRSSMHLRCDREHPHDREEEDEAQHDGFEKGEATLFAIRSQGTALCPLALAVSRTGIVTGIGPSTRSSALTVTFERPIPSGDVVMSV